jgi:prepilin-type N-terminal cleavage/methylation domain-containing protein
MNSSVIKNRSSTEGGFTLVEIAIVLVIIGLLLGGILKGQEMITQAKIKNIVNDFNGITVAVTSYQDRYRALPGDDIGANARWTTQSPANGNGNGNIAGLYNALPGASAPATAAESNLFWQHLRIAGFVAGATTGGASGAQPPNAAGGIIGVETGNPGTSGLGFSSLILCFSNLPEKIASAVDGQIDDGVPNTGQIRGQLGGSNPPTANSAGGAATAYVETGVNQYLLCKNY